MKTHLIFASVALTLASPALGQQPDPLRRTLTLQEAVAIGLKQGSQARAAQATREAARYRDRAFNARLLPQLTLSGDMPRYNRSIIPVLQPDGSTLFRPQELTNAAMTATVSQKLPFTGGDLFLSSSLARLSITGAQATQSWSAAPVTVGIRQDILRPNAAAWDRKLQNVQAELSERQYLESREDISLQIANVFVDAYGARVSLETATKNAAVNDTLYTLNKGRFEVAKIGENDLLQSELALLRARAALDAARLEYDRAESMLRLALGLPEGLPIEVVIDAHVAIVEVDTAKAVNEAMANRATVSDNEFQALLARRRLSEARYATGWGATIQASYGFNATAPEASLAYRDLLEARQFQVQVQIPLWQWGGHGAAVRAADAERDRTSLAADASLGQLRLEAKYAALQLVQARRMLELSAKADTVADKRFEVAYNRYVIGRIAIDNLYQAQGEKDQARNQFVQAVRGYWQVYYRLRKLTLFDFETGQRIT